MSVLLSYRGPGDSVSAQTAALIRRLRLREQLRFGLIALKFLIGVPACFGGPFIITLTLIGIGVGFWPLLAWTSAITIPLLFIYEERTRGQSILDLIRELRSGAALSTLFDDPLPTEYPRPLVVIEVLAVGPRITVMAVRELLARSRLRHVPLVQVARTLDLLLTFEHGTSPAELAARTDDIRGTLDAVIYLVFHGWAEMALDRRRVWIPLHIRDALKDRSAS